MENKHLQGITMLGKVIIAYGLLIPFVNWYMHPLSGTMQIDSSDFILLTAFNLTFIISGIFILKLKNWARFLYIVQVLILDVLLIFPMVQNKTANFYLIIVFLTLASIFFFIHPKVKEHFK